MTTETHSAIPVAGDAFLTTLQSFLRDEDAQRFAEMFQDFVVSGGTHGTVAGLTGTPAALTAYCGGYYVAETASITYTDNVTQWVIAHKDTTGDLGTFTRVPGTNYLVDRVSGIIQPSLPAASVWLMKVVTSGGAVTSVTDLRNLVPWWRLAASVTGTLRYDAGVPSIGNVKLESHAYASLPAAGTAGRLARVTDGSRGVWMDTGATWVPANGGVYNAAYWGAAGDLQERNDGAMTSGSAVLTGSGFTAADAGKPIVVWGAGATTTIDTCDSAAGWSATGANTVTTDAVVKKEGTASLKFTVDGTHTVGVVASKALAGAAAWNKHMIRLWYRTDRVGGISTRMFVVRLRAGGAIVMSLIPQMTAQNAWEAILQIRLPLYSDLSTVDSIELATAVDLGATCTIWLDFMQANDPLITTIAGYTNATTVTLAAVAGASIGPASDWYRDPITQYQYGTDDTVALQAWLNAGLDGAGYLLPRGKYLVTSPLIVPTNTREILITGTGGMGAAPPNNDGFHTAIVYCGAVATMSPVLKYVNNYGLLLQQLTISANFLAGWAFQLTKDPAGTSSQLAMLRGLQLGYSVYDNFMIGEATFPGISETEQNVVCEQVAFVGAGRSNVHTNQGEADLLTFRSCLSTSDQVKRALWTLHDVYAERAGFGWHFDSTHLVSAVEEGGSGATGRGAYCIHSDSTGPNGLTAINTLFDGPGAVRYTGYLNGTATQPEPNGLTLINCFHGGSGLVDSNNVGVFFSGDAGTKCHLTVIGGQYGGHIQIGGNVPVDQVHGVGVRFSQTDGARGLVDANLGASVPCLNWGTDPGKDLVAYTHAGTALILHRFAHMHRVTLQAAVTAVSLEGVAGGGEQRTIEFIQDATGGRTVTWGADFAFPGGSEPTIDTRASARTLVTLAWSSSDNKWRVVSAVYDYAVPPKGLLSINTTAVGNVGAGEDTLMSYTLPGKTLAVNGQTVRISAGGRFGATAGNKTLKLYVGSTVLYSTGAVAIVSDEGWALDATLWRLGATSERALTRALSSAALMIDSAAVVSPGETLANALNITVTGEESGGNSNGVVCEYLMVELLN